MGCRAGGDQDTEARLRVLEQQREDDHKYLLNIREHVEKLGAEIDRKNEQDIETQRYLHELTARGLQFQQGLAVNKSSMEIKLNDLQAWNEKKLFEMQHELFKVNNGAMDMKIAEVVAGT